MSSAVYATTAYVLESPQHGPQLVFVLNLSYPPQGSGPDVVGWGWDAVGGWESSGGTTWGAYTLVGTYDGERFELTGPPRVATAADVAGSGGPRTGNDGLAPDTTDDRPPRSEAELLAILEQVSREPGVLTAGVDLAGNAVELHVVCAEGLQARLDERYGTGVVRLTSALRRVR